MMSSTNEISASNANHSISTGTKAQPAKSGVYFLKRFNSLSSISWKNFIVIFTSLFSLVVIFGSSINSLGHKYSTTSVAGNSCRLEAFVLNIPNSRFCCDVEMAMHNKDWVCVAINDSLTKLLSSYASYLIAIIPWLLNVSFDKYRYSYLSFDRLQKSKSGDFAAISSFIRPHLLRLGLYVIIFLFRLVC